MDPLFRKETLDHKHGKRLSESWEISPHPFYLPGGP